jgi:hypothetical protein
LQVAFGAYAEPLKHAEQARQQTFKVALVAADCLLLGELWLAFGNRIIGANKQLMLYVQSIWRP